MPTAMKLRIHQFDLPLRHTFTIARGSHDVQPTVVVELEQDGQRGYGEATECEYYGFPRSRIVEGIELVRSVLEGERLEDEPLKTERLDDPAALWMRLQPVLIDNPFALCAIDQAAYDLWGKLRGQPVWKLWDLSISTGRLPPTDYTIGIDEIDVMVAKMREFPDWPVYKIKLGTPHDLEIVRGLRQHTDATFRVDANCGWSADETIANARELEKLGVEFIEQPLPPDAWDDMARVYRESVLPVVADESCITERDVARCRGFFHGVNIKLVKCGGLTPARRMIDNARKLGLKVMVGCMTESSVGISAIAQLLPLLDWVDMDGALLLARDVATGVTIERGVCRYPEVNGCGVTLLGEGD